MNEFYQAAREFARINGEVRVRKSNGHLTPLREGELDIIKTVEGDADLFEFNDKHYSRDEFSKLIGWPPPR